MTSSKQNWSVSRRNFVKGLVAAGISSQLGFIQACTNKLEGSDELIHAFFDSKELNTLTAIAETLFPNTNDGPNIQTINVIGHILWTFKDELYGFNSYDLFKRSIGKANDYTQETYQSRFETLNEAEKIETIEKISKLGWGESFLGKTLNYIFEALVIDPVYNVNKESVGWNWLNHQPGYPRPTKDQVYPQFLSKFQDEI